MVLLSRRFLVLARACLPRSLICSRLTASFWSSSSTSCYFRAVASLFWSVPPAPSWFTATWLAGGHSSTAILHSATAWSLDLRQRCSLPQLDLLTSRKLSGIPCHSMVQRHCVIFDPRVSATSLAEKVSVSLLHVLRVSRAAT